MASMSEIILALRSGKSASVPRGIVVAGVASRQHLRSATRQLLVVPGHQLSSYDRRAFCVASPSVWNSLPDSLRNPIIGENSFKTISEDVFVRNVLMHLAH